MVWGWSFGFNLLFVKVKYIFVLEKDFPDMTYMILMEKPKEVVDKVRNIIEGWQERVLM